MSADQSKDLHVRPAVLGDAEGIVHVHHAAVHETAAAFYSIDVLQAWSRPPNEARYQQVRRTVADDQELFLVAEDSTGLVGFGSIAPASEELRAVYVHPRMARRGVGSALLRGLEALALSRGCPHLHLEASLNAEAFYTKNGYVILRRGIHRLGTIEMTCVQMRKELVAQPEVT